MTVNVMPICPTCGRPAIKNSVRTSGGITTGSYMCAGEHLWTVRWLAHDDRKEAG